MPEDEKEKEKEAMNNLIPPIKAEINVKEVEEIIKVSTEVEYKEAEDTIEESIKQEIEEAVDIFEKEINEEDLKNSMKKLQLKNKSPKTEHKGTPERVKSDYVDYSKNPIRKTTEYYIQLLHRFRFPSDQILICHSLKMCKIADYIPHLINIMLRTKSDAIYNLLLYKCRSLQLRTTTFFYLKTILAEEEDVEKAALSYYLCCDLYELEIYQNRKNMPKTAGKTRRPNHIKFRTRAFTTPQNKNANFNGIVLSFLRSVAFYDKVAFDHCTNIVNIFSKKRNLRNISTKSSLLFKNNLKYYYDIVKISDLLAEVPKTMKQRLLIVNLELFNNLHSNNYITLFNCGRIRKIHVASALSLDSKANGPFMVNCILEHRSTLKSKRNEFDLSSDKMNKLRTLAYQFQTVKELDEISDLNGIRNNILVAMEQVVLEKIVREEMELEKKKQKKEKQKEESNPPLVESEKESKQPLQERIRGYFRMDVYEKQPNEPSPILSRNTLSFIVKNGTDMREEYLAFRIITQIKHIFVAHGVPIYLRNYKIVIITEETGLVETVVKTQSMHKIKEKESLLEYFKKTFNSRHRCTMESAKRNFLFSLVGYSLIQYLLSLKDRHNANILIDEYGHMIHIDFGFILGKYPGIYGVETAPFKFSNEYLDLVDLDEFKILFKEGFKCLVHNKSILPYEIKEKVDTGGTEPDLFCENLINKSVGNILTVLYDTLQYYENGYHK
ncbi:PI4KB [Enterospora canceri]|uniref:PI4KB n=1 Tax=Enterospora canceri TaxID=1081671 RepID=A0A1Y1S7R5_9MICR|nr:PI4KB [Enterospora canceri]